MKIRATAALATMVLALAACAGGAPPTPPVAAAAGPQTSESFLIRANDLAARARILTELAEDRGAGSDFAAPELTATETAAFVEDAQPRLREMDEQLSRLAAAKLPGPVDLSEETERARDELSTLQGPDFADAYARRMAAALDELRDLFAQTYEISGDPGVRSLIRDWRDDVADLAARAAGLAA